MPVEPGGEGVGVFAEDRLAGLAVDFPLAVVVAGDEAGEVGAGVHDVGFEKHDRAFVKPVGEQVAGPDVGLAGDGEDGAGAGRIAVRRQAGGGGHRLGHTGGDEHFFGMGALEQLVEHRKPLVGQADFIIAVGAVD